MHRFLIIGSWRGRPCVISRGALVAPLPSAPPNAPAPIVRSWREPIVSIDAIARQLKLARADLLADVPGALERYRYWLEEFDRLRPKPLPYRLELTNPGD
jgi:hypothetical protein